VTSMPVRAAAACATVRAEGNVGRRARASAPEGTTSAPSVHPLRRAIVESDAGVSLQPAGGARAGRLE